MKGIEKMKIFYPLRDVKNALLFFYSEFCVNSVKTFKRLLDNTKLIIGWLEQKCVGGGGGRGELLFGTREGAIIW